MKLVSRHAARPLWPWLIFDVRLFRSVSAGRAQWCFKRQKSRSCMRSIWGKGLLAGDRHRRSEDGAEEVFAPVGPAGSVIDCRHSNAPVAHGSRSHHGLFAAFLSLSPVLISCPSGIRPISLTRRQSQRLHRSRLVLRKSLRPETPTF